MNELANNFIINNFLLYIILNITLIHVCSFFLEYKFNKSDILKISSFFVTVYVLSVLSFNIFILISIAIPIYIFFYKRNISFRNFRIIFITGYITILMRISEIIIAIIYTYINVTSDKYFNIHKNLIFILLILILTPKVNKFLTSLISNFISFETYYKIVMLLLSSMLIIYNFIWLYSYSLNNAIIYYISISIIFTFLLILILISSSLLKNLHIKMEVEAEKQKLEQQKKYIESLERNNNEIRKFKHDFNNIILGLEGYITNNEVNNVKLRDYFYNNIKDFNTKIELDNIVLSHLNNIKVPSIKNLLTNKIISAQNNDFKVNICVEDEIDDFYVNEMQLSRVLGIFLDNSLEAGLELDNNRFLELIILKVNKTIVIQITNTFKNTNLDIDQINESGYSSKGENRGIGLSSANDIISKHNMILNTRIEDNLFKQILTIEGEL